MHSQHALVGLGCILLLGGCQPAAEEFPQPKLVDPVATYVHEPSGFTFPKTTGTFIRGDMRFNDRNGQSISVAYGLVQLAVITATVYPAPQPPSDQATADEFKRCCDDVLAHHSGAKLVAEESQPVDAGHKDRPARHASFLYQGTHQKLQQSMCYDLYLMRMGDWFVRYDGYYPTNDKLTGDIGVRGLITELNWPDTKKAPDAKPQEPPAEKKAPDAKAKPPEGKKQEPDAKTPAADGKKKEK